MRINIQLVGSVGFTIFEKIYILVLMFTRKNDLYLVNINETLSCVFLAPNSAQRRSAQHKEVNKQTSKQQAESSATLNKQ